MRPNELSAVERAQAAFGYFLAHATTGTRLTYHVGFLAFDRFETEDNGLTYQTVEPIHTLAKTVWDAYIRGEVNLVQKRLSDMTYEYYAEKV